MAKAKQFQELDFSAFPHNTVTRFEKTLCLSCVADTFTTLLGIAPRTALQEMKGYTPSVAELTSAAATRPYFEPVEPEAPCPYCGAPQKKHARLFTYRIEGGKATDGARRKLIANLDAAHFNITEEKSTQDEAFVDWLTRMARIDQSDEEWLRHITRVFLERKLPRENWEEIFRDIWTARRSMRLEEGWEVDNRRLFLCPSLYAEALVVQYLVSRSQHGGGLTLEGRLTLPELVLRLRHFGYLRTHNITAHNPGDVLEALMHHLAGDGGVKLYYIIDRRDFLEKLAAVKPAAPAPTKAPKQPVAKTQSAKPKPQSTKPASAKQRAVATKPSKTTPTAKAKPAAKKAVKQSRKKQSPKKQPLKKSAPKPQPKPAAKKTAPRKAKK